MEYKISLTKKERKELAETIEVFLLQYIREDPSIDAFPWLINICKLYSVLDTVEAPIEILLDEYNREDLENMIRMNIVAECEFIENTEKGVNDLEALIHLRRKIKDLKPTVF